MSARITKQGRLLLVGLKAAGMTYKEFTAALGRAGIASPAWRIYGWLTRSRPIGKPAIKAIARVLGDSAALNLLIR